MAATIRDVARVARVSLATVSRALNDPAKVAEGTRARIDAAVAKLGYVPHEGARSLSSRRTGCIGAVLAPGKSCNITVALKPVTARFYTATLEVSGDKTTLPRPGVVKTTLNATGV